MTSEQDNARLVAQLHANAQGLLDLGTLLSLLANDVEWWAAGSPDVLPWAGTHLGRTGVENFFRILNSLTVYDHFQPVEFIAQGEMVVETILAKGRATATERPFESEVVRIWTLRSEHIVKVRSYYDTYAYVAALQR